MTPGPAFLLLGTKWLRLDNGWSMLHAEVGQLASLKADQKITANDVIEFPGLASAKQAA
jgi:hypothetical protein